MADRSHPYRRLRTQYSLEILHVPCDYPLDELEGDLQHRWGYCIDNFRTIQDNQYPTLIFYINFSTKSDAMDCEDYLKGSGRMTKHMYIREQTREVSFLDNDPMGAGGVVKEKKGKGRGRGRGRNRGRGANFVHHDEERYNPHYDLGNPEPPKVEKFNMSYLPTQDFNNPYPTKQEYSDHFSPPRQDDFSYSPKREYNKFDSNASRPGQERSPHYPKPENNPTPKQKKNDNIIHVGNIPSFVDQDILRDLLLGKHIEGVLEIKIREDRSDKSVNEALIYVSDESAVEETISKLNHVKVAGKPLTAKRHRSGSSKKEIDLGADLVEKKSIRKEEINPQDYISSEVVDESPKFAKTGMFAYPSLSPGDKVRNIPRRESQTEDLAEKSVKMSIQLYDFVKAKFRPQIEAFSAENGVFLHHEDTLILKSSNPTSLSTLYKTITNEVSEEKQTYSEDDYNFLGTKDSNKQNLVEEKAHMFMTAGQIRYYLDSSACTLHVFGIRNCVDVVVNHIQESLYYQFVLQSPMDIYISIFPGLIPETIGSSGSLRESKVVISSRIGIQECKNIRDKLKQIQTSLICEPCITFPLELITSGLKFCKEKNLRVAIIFKDSKGLLYKKYKPETIVTLCGNNVQVLTAKQVFSKPICCELAATRDGLMLLEQTTGRNLSMNKSLEQEFAISIQLFTNSVKLQGFLRSDLDKACDRIKRKLDRVELFLSQFLEGHQIEFLIEAANSEVNWTMDILSELELNYGIQLVKTNRDYKLKGNQEAFQKIESEKHQISAIFKDIILHYCDPIYLDKSSCDFISKLLENFVENHLENEDIFLCYGWDFKDSRNKPNQLDMRIQLVGTKDHVNLITTKIQTIKPEKGKLRDKYLPNEVEKVDQIGSILKNIEDTEFVCFHMINQRIEYHTLGISSKKPWEIFDEIMSDQMVVRSIPIKYEILYFLRSKKLLKDCETEFQCSIIEEHQERGSQRGDRRRRGADQHENINALTVKGKNADVKVTLEKLKKWIDNFTCKSIDLRFNRKIFQYFIANELESLKREIESKEVLVLDIREAKRKILKKDDVENEDEISFSVRIETLDENSCTKFVTLVEEKLKIVESKEYPLNDRQLSILMSALKDQKIPKNEHFYVDVVFKSRRTGSAKILALKHFKDAIEKGISATSPYLQFKDQMYTPPKFLQEILFHHQKYTICMNTNAKTLGIECTRPNNAKENYKFSGNKSSIEKMLFNLKNFEIGFVRLCDKIEVEVNLPLDEFKKDFKYTALENDMVRNCNVKIFPLGGLPLNIENEVKKGSGNFQYTSDEINFFEQDDSQNNTLGTFTFGNITIQVIKGDITKVTVCCIINGATAELDHGLGLAKAISDAGGPSIQKGCYNYVQDQGSLAIGGAVLQGAGNLPCTKIIHVSCPSWNTNCQKKCTDDLANCIQTALALCEAHNLHSIAIPGLCTGIFGFPPRVSTNAIVQECKKHIQDKVNSCIKRILFIDCSPPIVRSFNQDCQKAFGLNSSQYLSEDFDFSESIYGSSLNFNAQEKSPLDSAPPATVEFLWQEDDQQFYPYDAKYQNLLQKAYQVSPQGKATFQRGKYIYSVHFKSLEQVNETTQVKRKIKMNTIVNPDNIPLPKPNVFPGIGDLDGDDSGIHCLWYFLNEFNAWTPYQKDVAKKLSDAYLDNPKGNVSVEINGYTYIIDFNTMKQTNQSTHTSRDVKVDKKMLEAAMSALGDISGEKVILYGLQTSLHRAKGKFNHFIQAITFNKEFDIHGLPKTVMIPKIIKQKKNYSFVKIEIKDKGEDYCIKLNGFEKEVRTVHDELKDHYIKFLEQVTKQDQASGITFPKEWEQHGANEMIRLVPLVNSSPEWLKVANQFNKTSAKQIVQIDRIQNKWLWRKYQQTKDSFKEINQNSNEITVFHGTRNTDPSLIFKGTEGFDFRHSSKGMWGKANYFAVNASFCESYQYVDPATQFGKFFMLKLLAGNVVHLHSDSSLTMPPLLPQGSSNFVGQRYDTVSGDHSGGSKIYMLYTNERTYPEYLITYS